MEQGTAEWMRARCGKVGCSRLGDVMAFGKNGAPLKRRTDYLFELLCERLTGQIADHFRTPAMEHGIEYEPEARVEYEVRNGVMVYSDGGKEHPTIPGWRGSPDGLVGDDGGLEIKCPTTETHVRTLLYGEINPDYIYQMTGYVLIFDRQWWDFVSYDPRLPINLGYVEWKYLREELPCAEVVSGVKNFLAELDEMESKVRSRV